MLVASDGEQFNVPMYLVDRSKVLQRLWDFQAEWPPVVPLRSHDLRAHIQFDASHIRSSNHEIHDDKDHILVELVQVLHVCFHTSFLARFEQLRRQLIRQHSQGLRAGDCTCKRSNV